MIIGLWHQGSGLGDQLFCYLAARITAERLGVPFSMVGEFKGKDFMRLPSFESPEVPHHVEMPAGKIVVDADMPLYEGKTYYDPEFNFIQDDTIVDGCRLQDERYWEGYPIKEWLKTEPRESPDDLCVINFRGGEFAKVPELFLGFNYWEPSIKMMKEINPQMKFEIHTDDPKTAVRCLSIFVPDIVAIHDVAINWRAVRNAKYAIIANSAFGIIPRLLNGGKTIAPRYWARRNIKEWSTPQNYYKSFTHI